MYFPKKAIVLILMLPVSAWAAPTFDVDPYRLLDIANRALEQKFPELKAGTVPLANDIYVYCEPAQPKKRNLLLDEEFRPCEASVVYDLNQTSQVSFQHDGKGGCLESDPPGWAEVRILNNGNATVKPYRSREIQPNAVECSEEVITQMATLMEPVTGLDEAFSVNPNEILDQAFIAALDKHPELDPEKLDIEFNLHLLCDVYPHENPRPQSEKRIKTCVAEVILMNTSASVFEQTVDSRGKCWSTESVPTFRVKIDNAGKEMIRSGSEIEMSRIRTQCEE
ncbi:MAG TPA: hypothetical protein VJ984_05865 [Xanthomonadales bacterium]|nr:hypothetical protein [Xanthomonadales bacterium]